LTIAWPILLLGFDGLAEFALFAAAFVVLAAVALFAAAFVVLAAVALLAAAFVVLAAEMELTVTDVTNTMPRATVRVIPKILDTIFSITKYETGIHIIGYI
jgi:hypothetical protein